MGKSFNNIASKFGHCLNGVKGMWSVILFSLFGLLACQPKSTDIKKPLFLRLVDNDSLNGYFDNTIKEVISLPDNSFWVHYRIDYFDFHDRFEHYSADFKLLKTVTYRNYVFGNFIVRGNNDIVVSAGYKTGNTLYYHFIRFDNDFNVLQINQDPAIKENLKPLFGLSFANYSSILKNGNTLFGFYTTDNNPGQDSARIIIASYKDPFNNSQPEWVMRNMHADPNQGIRNNTIVDLATDDDNNFYVLGMATNYALTLRKHAADGKLIWQRKITNTDYIEERYTGIQIESDRVLVTSTHDRIYIFDLAGNYIEKKLPFQITGKVLPTLNGDGYIAISDTFNGSVKHATMLKFDRDFNLLKVKTYGNQGTNWSSAPRMNRLAGGEIIVAGFVEAAYLREVNLLLYKTDDNLELDDE